MREGVLGSKRGSYDFLLTRSFQLAGGRGGNRASMGGVWRGQRAESRRKRRSLSQPRDVLIVHNVFQLMALMTSSLMAAA